MALKQFHNASDECAAVRFYYQLCYIMSVHFTILMLTMPCHTSFTVLTELTELLSIKQAQNIKLRALKSLIQSL
jgi:hypothetical protein